MFGTLPGLTPRDTHSLWYSSSRGPVNTLTLDALPNDNNNNGTTHHQRQRNAHLLERSPLHRLAVDEHHLHRRRLNVANFGSHWLKPPGVPKTLHQMREEKREQEEHAEAVRREQMAQELAEAEGGLPGEEEMDDVQLDGAGDLDDEIPEAGSDFMMGSAADPSEDDDDDDDDDEGDSSEADESALREERTNDLVAARMRMTDDAFREALIRGDPDGGDMYGSDEEEQEEDAGHLLDEEDFVAEHHMNTPMVAGDDSDLGMDADLDGDVPEAEDGGYEHTDSEAEITSSEDDESGSDEEGEDQAEVVDVGFAPRTAPLGQPTSPTLRGRGSLSANRRSLEMSLLSHEESSFMDSSPAQARRARYG